MARKRTRYALADSAQQVVGGVLLAGPFVVTEEVWLLAGNLSPLHVALQVLLVFVIGYVALYEAEEERKLEEESRIAGVPLRFISLMLVSYLSVALLMLLLAAPTTFEAGLPTTAKVVTTCAIFSMVGAATADSLF